MKLIGPSFRLCSLLLPFLLPVNSTFALDGSNSKSRGTEQKKRTGVSVTLSQNPFGDDATLNARLNLIDRAFRSLRWFSEQRVELKDGVHTSYLISDSIIQAMALSPERTETLNALFRERSERHTKNLEPLNSQRMRERDLKAQELGFPTKLLVHVSVPELPKEEVAKRLVAYEAAEIQAEQEMLEKLKKLLSRSELSRIADCWLESNRLYTPFAKFWLELTDDQVAKIRTASYEKLKFEYQVREAITSSKIEDYNEALVSDPIWFDHTFLPYSFLNVDQFKKAKWTMKRIREVDSFDARIKSLKGADSLAAKSELRILGTLYEEGRRQELLNRK